MKIAQVGLLLTLVAVSAAAQAQHSLTYSQVSVAPGTIVNIGDRQFVAVQVGVRQFTTDKRYAVRFLSDLYYSDLYMGNVVDGTLVAQHSNAPLPAPNATIDGAPAQIEVNDGRTYSIETNLDGQTLEPINTLVVRGFASVTVQVKIGDTLLIGTYSFQQHDQAADLGPNEFRGTSKSIYGKYADPLGLIDNLDKVIDYIRVIPLN